MQITCVSDLHGFFPKLEGGDLLVVAGDLTRTDSNTEHDQFDEWLARQNYKKKIVIAGNHDNKIEDCHDFHFEKHIDAHYLEDSGTEFEGLKIWGSPWTKRFPGMNPRCMAFTVDTDEELAEKWALIPKDTNILITHCPPYGILDQVRTDSKINKGSPSLRERVCEVKPMAVFYGHIHENGLEYETKDGILFVNASYVDERYKPRSGYIRCQMQNSSFTASVIPEQKK